MESSAPKRRKTSPSTSVPVDATETNVESMTPRGSPPRIVRRGSMPSFASPTKASLAKHNPEILGRRRAAVPAADDTPEPGASRPSSRHDDGGVSATIDAQLEAGSELRPTETVASANTVNETVSNARALAQSVLEAMRSPVRRFGGGMASQPRRSPAKPQPRPLPPPEPENEEDILNPFMGRALRRSPIGDVGSAVPTTVEEEPELPPTPEHPDPVVSTPPSGIHNTPSKRPRRSKAVASNIRSSPLKPVPFRALVARRGPVEQHVEAPPFNLPSKEVKPVELSTSQMRGIRLVDSNTGKNKIHDSLLTEVTRLEADLEVARKEAKLIRRSQNQLDDDSSPAASSDKLLELLRRHDILPPGADPVPDPSAAFLEVTKNPISFLPFSKQPSALLNLFERSISDDDSPVPVSHHPAEMSAEEELSYLQAFVPLSFSSEISVLPREAPEAPLVRKHNIEIASRSPAGLFSATVEMKVDTHTLAIVDLQVPRLDPAAAPELLPFIKNIINPMASVNRLVSTNILLRNNNVMIWAMGEWVRVAVRRAKFWCAVDKELAFNEALAASVSSSRHKTRRRRRRGSSPGAPEPDMEDEGEEGVEHSRQKSSNYRFSLRDLLPQMGRTSMDLAIPVAGPGKDSSDLRVHWRIEFDATGEAQSRLAVQVSMPGKWHRHDSRSRLADMPQLFDKLLEDGKGPLAAVKVIVALLASDV
ncbi:hypothetical protein NKR23_g7218 [Pleurostoma richardsiae]|uniref:Uncharacterized protein n=1 Tax=Pleurostoma richardsiae TaxID=41990 RepID=A0AA38RND3_9PEZI|nr:hypothetical protein NKR23_g7218 [Pleurostoma richardsiae]